MDEKTLLRVQSGLYAITDRNELDSILLRTIPGLEIVIGKP